MTEPIDCGNLNGSEDRVCHEIVEQSSMKKDDSFNDPPNMGNVIWRLPELWTDPSSNQLSASRFVTFWVGVWICVIALHETFEGRAGAITTMITATFATVAGIYFGSTIKDFRWRKWREKE